MLSINPECASAIRDYLHTVPQRVDGDAYLFQAMRNSRVGNSMSRDQMNYLFNRYAAQAGIDLRTFPRMAHAIMVTSAYEAGATGEEIQRTVGLSSITTTKGYNYIAREHRESASLKVGY